MPKRDFPVPPGIAFAAIDSSTGLLFGPNCPKKNKLLEAFAAGTEPKKYCDLDHAKSIADQLEAEEAPHAAEGSVLPPSIGASTAAAPSPAALPAKAEEPPPLPTDEELENGKPAPGAEEPTGLE
jgi:hypothetical protein